MFLRQWHRTMYKVSFGYKPIWSPFYTVLPTKIQLSENLHPTSDSMRSRQIAEVTVKVTQGVKIALMIALCCVAL